MAETPKQAAKKGDEILVRGFALDARSVALRSASGMPGISVSIHAYDTVTPQELYDEMINEEFVPGDYGTCETEHGNKGLGMWHIHQKRIGGGTREHCLNWKSVMVPRPPKHEHELYEEEQLIKCKECSTTWGVSNG